MPAETARSGQPAGATRAQVLADPSFYGLLAAMLPPSFISNTLFFHQVHLAESRGWSPDVLAAAFPPYAVATFVVLLVAGRLVDRFSALALLPLYLVPFGLACLILGGVSAPWAAFAFMLLYGVTDGISLTLFGALWPEVYGTRHLGAIRGAIVAIMVLGTALGPVLSGLLIDAGIPFSGIVTGMGVYCLAVSGILLLVRRRFLGPARAPLRDRDRPRRPSHRLGQSPLGPDPGRRVVVRRQGLAEALVEGDAGRALPLQGRHQGGGVRHHQDLRTFRARRAISAASGASRSACRLVSGSLSTISSGGRGDRRAAASRR